MSPSDEPLSDRRSPDETGESPRSAATSLLALWFGLSSDVTRRAYAASGFGLMALKYAVEAGLLKYFSGRFFSILDFLNPLLSLRQEFFKAPTPDWVAWAFFLWTLPFL